MAVRYGRDHVRVNAVLPGVTLSERVVGRTQGVVLPQVWVDRHLLGFQKPEQVARAALFLASDDAAGITGQNLAVDSGYGIS
jgi:NAD(P)-dependent dehydrogenase (short-subunit alcohol dehydrogenase family)